jgi:Protein of unknown function (DUF2800)
MLTLEQAVQILEFQKPYAKLVAQAENVVQCEIESGTDVPGWKLSEKSGKRQWVDEDEIICALANAGFEEEQYTDKKLKSPYQIEETLNFKTDEYTTKYTETVLVPAKARGRKAAESPDKEFA